MSPKDYSYLNGYSLMIMREASSYDHSCYNDLACQLVNALMDDEEKNRFRLHILANGGCASPHEIVDFNRIVNGKEDAVEKIVGDWLSSQKGHLVHQAYLNSCFDNEFMRGIADAAWRNKVC